MKNHLIIPLDLNFQDMPQVIAAYLLPHSEGGALIESGPGSTLTTLKNQLKQYGLRLEDITDVFLTHIHLDHAGAAGALAQHGATIHVHPFGAPHLINPEKLLSSASRIYGEDMDRLWGQFEPVPEGKISFLTDNVPVEFNEIQLLPLDTPGHANHHMAFIYQGVCFSGDVGGVRLAGLDAVRAPMPPPEFHLEKWMSSLEKISSHAIQIIAPTHFGMFQDPERHLEMLKKRLSEAAEWMEATVDDSVDLETLRHKFLEYNQKLDQDDQLQEGAKVAFELANPAFMSADGIFRYWKKYR